MTHAMHAAATGTGSEEGGDNTALAPSAEESALAQLLQAARNVANSGVDTYLQRLKQDRVDVGKQLATTTENITKVRELGPCVSLKHWWTLWPPACCLRWLAARIEGEAVDVTACCAREGSGNGGAGNPGTPVSPRLAWWCLDVRARATFAAPHTASAHHE